CSTRISGVQGLERSDARSAVGPTRPAIAAGVRKRLFSDRPSPLRIAPLEELSTENGEGHCGMSTASNQLRQFKDLVIAQLRSQLFDYGLPLKERIRLFIVHESAQAFQRGDSLKDIRRTHLSATPKP